MLDLKDIGFVSASEASFSGTSSGGVLTVSDGAHTAMIRLTGDYLGDTFEAASDGGGGVAITASATPRVGAMAQAMAGVSGGQSAETLVIEAIARHVPTPHLLAPRFA